MARILLGILLAAAAAAAAQDYPAREIRSICNFSAGSGADIIVRYYSDRLARLAGRPVIVENRPGAQGLVATDYAAKSKPDGYTILITPASSTLATAPHIFKHLPFDPLRDFAPVTTINSLAFVIAVSAGGPLRSMDELVARLRAKPGHGFYGTTSNSGQVTAELFKELSGLKTEYVPFKVTTDGLASLLGGEIDFFAIDATWAVTQHPHKIRILAVTSAKRAGVLPDVPTMQELGFKDFDITPWWGVVVAAGTPRPIVERLAGWFNQITAMEETRQFLARGALDPLPGTPDSMAALLRTETERWGRFVRLAKIEPQ
ncbi:MAG TPA: tripartite tricarboxylate transporter substrate binding protein [Burkholderiales bacterium]|nr:tripartite tricarboxylate transporter substrate binding protein [Burkholderiales bacterium]